MCVVVAVQLLSYLYICVHMCRVVSGEVMVCVLDFKRKAGLWHGVLTVSSPAKLFVSPCIQALCCVLLMWSETLVPVHMLCSSCSELDFYLIISSNPSVWNVMFYYP